MEPIVVLDVVVAALALLVFGVTSISELGGGAVTRRRILMLQEDIRAGKRTTHAMIEASRARTASIEVVRLIAVVVAAIAINDLVDHWLDDVVWLVDAVLLSALLLVFGVGLPRVVLDYAPERALEVLAQIAGFLARMANPILGLADYVSRPFRHLFGAENRSFTASEDEIRDVSLARTEDEALQVAEQEMIDGVLALEDLAARDIMVPRTDMIAASINMPPRQLLQLITDSGHSRIPIFDQSIDEILGVLHAKDLLPFVMRDGRDVRIRPLVRSAYIVPESKRVDELLRDMRIERQQLAILADEYGGIAGLVSIEDVVEQIVGTIHDEYDRPVEETVRLSANIIEASGGVSIIEVLDEFDLNEDEFDDDDYDTIGGFVLKHLGRLPIQGDVVEAEGLRVNVLSVERHRVQRVRIERMGGQPSNDAILVDGDGS